jgi:hypothetical protein
MKVPLITILLLFLCHRLVAQSDSATIVQVLNEQLAFADKCFGKQLYVLNRSTVPWDTTRGEFQPNSEYNRFLCGKYMTWTDEQIASDRCTVKTDTTTNDYSCFIATPIFNSDKTKCRVYMGTHYSEWGGSGRFFYYEKKRNKWKLVRLSLVWVS